MCVGRGERRGKGGEGGMRPVYLPLPLLLSCPASIVCTCESRPLFIWLIDVRGAKAHDSKYTPPSTTRE